MVAVLIGISNVGKSEATCLIPFFFKKMHTSKYFGKLVFFIGVFATYTVFPDFTFGRNFIWKVYHSFYYSASI